MTIEITYTLDGLQYAKQIKLGDPINLSGDETNLIFAGVVKGRRKAEKAK